MSLLTFHESKLKTCLKNNGLSGDSWAVLMDCPTTTHQYKLQRPFITRRHPELPLFPSAAEEASQMASPTLGPCQGDKPAETAAEPEKRHLNVLLDSGQRIKSGSPTFQVSAQANEPAANSRATCYLSFFSLESLKNCV